MSLYITLQDLKDYIDDKQVAIFDIQDSILEKMIAHAEGVVDSFLVTNYELPLPTSSFIKYIALPIATQQVWNYAKSSALPEKHKNAYLQSMELLKKIAQKEILLPHQKEVKPHSNRKIFISEA